MTRSTCARHNRSKRERRSMPPWCVEQLRKRGRKPLGDGPARVVPVRLDDTLLSALDERAERDHTTRSELIRAALRSYVM